MNKLDKQIFGTLFFSIFSVVTGIGIVVPLLPVYAHDLGANGLYIALIFGSFSISRTLLLPYFGRASDQKGRKTFIVAGLFSYTLISIAFMFAASVNALIVIRFIQGIASAMIMPVAQAYIGDITPEGKEGFFMGMFNMSVFLSLSIGPIIGGFVKDHFNLQAAFASMGLLSLIAFLLSFFLLPSVKSEHINAGSSKIIAWNTLLKDRTLAGLFSMRFVYVTCIGIIWCFLPIYADSAFNLSSSQIGILVMLGIAISGLFHTPMGYLADRWNKKAMVIIGGLIVVAATFSFQWATGFHDLFIASTCYGIGGGICMPPLMALAVIKGNESNSMGSVMGLLIMGHSFGMLIGSLLAGLTMDYLDLKLAFPLGSVIMLCGIIVFIICSTEKKTI